MAKSGTINGTRSGRNPYLRINWNIDQTDVGGNRTRLRLRLYLMHPYNTNFSDSKSGVLQGGSFTHTGGARGTGNTLIRTHYIWVSHNSDGTKTQKLSASFNIAIMFSGSWMGSISVSGKASLDAIPRASVVTGGSIQYPLQPGDENRLNISIDRKHSGFTHLVEIRDGNTWIGDWGYGTGTPSSLTISTAAVDRMLNAMSSVTSKSFTLRVRTYSDSNGKNQIGSTSRSITANVHTSVAPYINSTSVIPTGNPWAINQGLYVQGQTGLQAEFSSNATGGANVRSRNILVGSAGGGSVVGSVYRHNIGTIEGTGSRTITYEITDTRGRKTTSTRTISILAYSPPRASLFEANRKSGASTTVVVHRNGTSSALDNRNQARLTITEEGPSGTRTIQDITFYGNFGNTVEASNVSDTASYTYRLTVVDALGNRATASATIGTASVLLSLNKDKGVGIGKIHEEGALDVQGESYINGMPMVYFSEVEEW